MKSCLLMSLVLMLCATRSSSAAANYMQGHGRVNLHGTIVEKACAIAVESVDQTINFGPVNISNVFNRRQAAIKAMKIRLVDCQLTSPKSNQVRLNQFRVTFDGDNNGQGIDVQGTAKGLMLVISDAKGNRVLPGRALPPLDITPGDMVLNYELQLERNNQPMKAGDFTAFVKYKIDYY